MILFIFIHILIKVKFCSFRLSDDYLEFSSNNHSIITNLKSNSTNLLSILKNSTTVSINVIPQIVHYALYYDNTELVLEVLHTIEHNITNQYIQSAPQLLHQSIMKLIQFWLINVQHSSMIYPEIYQQSIKLLQKLSLTPTYRKLLKTHAITKSIRNASNSIGTEPMLKQILNQIEGIDEPLLLENIIVSLQSNHAEQNRAISSLNRSIGTSSSLIMEGSVRDQVFGGLIMGVLRYDPQEHRQIKMWNNIINEISNNVTANNACYLINKGILKCIHNSLQQKSIDLHSQLFNLTNRLIFSSTKHHKLPIQPTIILINSPYPQFQKTLLNGLVLMAENKISSGSVFVPYIKDLIKLSLKSNNENSIISAARILAALAMDQQCRYQIMNLKGIQVFCRLLEDGVKARNALMQQASSKGLLNLCLSTRQAKAKIMLQMVGILQAYYQGRCDVVAGGYIEAMLKCKGG